MRLCAPPPCRGRTDSDSRRFDERDRRVAVPSTAPRLRSNGPSIDGRRRSPPVAAAGGNRRSRRGSSASPPAAPSALRSPPSASATSFATGRAKRLRQGGTAGTRERAPRRKRCEPRVHCRLTERLNDITADAGKIFPGFRMPLDRRPPSPASSARSRPATARAAGTAPSAKPMPCSPLIDPSSATTPSNSTAPPAPARASSSASSGPP